MHIYNFKAIFRSLVRYKSFTLINLLGLSIGIAAALIISLIYNFENSFDDHHSTAENIYRVVTMSKQGKEEVFNARVPYPTGKFLRNEYPQGTVTQIHFSRNMNVQIGKEDPFEETNVVFAQLLFFRVFDYAQVSKVWLTGNQVTALSVPNKAILTAKTAQRYFGNANPIGKLIRLNNLVDVEVIALISELPSNSHLPVNMMVSYPTINKEFLSGLDQDSWTFTSSGYAYMKLHEGSSVSSANAALKAIVQKHVVSERHKKEVWSLQELRDIHFDTVYEDSNPSSTVSRRYLVMLLILGAFIVLIACVNYINLSTSLAFSKSKEVGIRKTIGASRPELFRHYMTETFVITFIAALISILITAISLPAINSLFDKSISITQLFTVQFISGMVAGVLLISFISGIYPAIILARFNPIVSLKERLVAPEKSFSFIRRGLVIFQFTTSIILIICTIVIAMQMQYFQSKELGFNKESVVEVSLPEADSLRIEKFRALIQNESGIMNLSFCLGAPISDNEFETNFDAPGLPANSEHSLSFIPCDNQYLNTYGMKLAAGRWFNKTDELSAGRSIVTNESLVRKLGYKNASDAIGKKIRLSVSNYQPEIIGVTGDFHVSSFHEQIQPVVLMPFPDFYYAVAIRLQPGDMHNTLAKIASAWKKVYPESVYQFKFLDETLAERYKQESRDYNLFRSFSLISIFICCIGLWGLIAFVVVRKTKEIGIRKVLGASIKGIVLLLSKDFLKLIIIAFLIASPLAWYFMNKWLQGFAYRINLGWWIFMVAGATALLIAFLTVSYQAIKAALANPVKNLRTE